VKHCVKVILAYFFNTVVVDVERVALFRGVELVYLGFFLDQVVSSCFVGELAHLNRLDNVFAHLLLLEVLLPLLHIEVLAMDLVKDHVHFLFLSNFNILFAYFLLDFKLLNFHVFKFYLTGDKRVALLAHEVTFA